MAHVRRTLTLGLLVLTRPPYIPMNVVLLRCLRVTSSPWWLVYLGLCS